jgi:hypothetical protein
MLPRRPVAVAGSLWISAIAASRLSASTCRRLSLGGQPVIAAQASGGQDTVPDRPLVVPVRGHERGICR